MMMPSRSSQPDRYNVLMRHLLLAWRLFLDARVEPLLKLIPIVGLLYLFSPIDLIPDMFLGVGQVDDLAVLLLAIQTFIRLAPPDVVEQYRRELHFDGEDEDVIEGEWRDLEQ